MQKIIEKRIEESIQAKQKLLADEQIVGKIAVAVDTIVNCLKSGGKIVICGNGGSASDALHFAGEILGRFQKDRQAWPAIVLNADMATMTSIANDYGYDEVFSRQAKAFLKPEDVLVGISTSGNSKNVYNAAKVAKEIGAQSIGLLGKDGGKIKDIVSEAITVPQDCTARIQECHIMIIHIICELVEEKL